MQELPDCIVGHKHEPAGRATEALDRALVAQTSNALVATRRAVARLARLAAREPARVQVIPPTEQGTERGDLGGCWEILTDGCALSHLDNMPNGETAVQRGSVAS